MAGPKGPTQFFAPTAGPTKNLRSKKAYPPAQVLVSTAWREDVVQEGNNSNTLQTSTAWREDIVQEGNNTLNVSTVWVESIFPTRPDQDLIQGRKTPPIFRPKDVIKVRSTKAYPILTSSPLTPGLLTNTNTFFGPTLTPGSVNLAPGRLTNTQTFFPPTIILGHILEPDVLTNTPIFYPPVFNGPATIEPHLYTSPNTFFPPTITVTQDLTPGLLTNTQTFFSPSLNPGLRPGLLVNTQTFFPPSILATTSGFIEPQLFISNETFFFPVTIAVEEEPRPGDDREFKVGRVVNKGYVPLSLKIKGP